MTERPFRLSASLLAADFARLGEEVRAAASAGCDEIHFDAMDGRFVPNLTFGAPVLAAARRHTALPIDAHLMIHEPVRFVPDFAAAGATTITVHVEACVDLDATIEAVRAAGARPGVAINPSTPAAAVDGVLGRVDRVLVMTVNPGFGGQEFIAGMAPKIAQLRRAIDSRGLAVELAVDGGVNAATGVAAFRAGARTLVAGSALFGYPGGIREGARRIAGEIAAANPAGRG